VVVAESWEAAWQTAMDTDSWDILPFDVDSIACFPRDVVTK
tara:strand:+ start:470 stop:592 length:123 start_codon:yes stop_codon:yes gene_type:complete